jgi:CelD/BcsL family acetyltransferase involved in cellulose biosynthesis
MYSSSIVDNVDFFKDLKKEWTNLLDSISDRNIFSTWEWLFSWWEIFGERNKLFIITLRNPTNQELVGIAPLFIHRTAFYKFPVRELSFIGLNQSDRQNFICAPDDSHAIDNFFTTIIQYGHLWDIVRLDQISSPISIFPFNYEGLIFKCENSSICPYVRRNGGGDTYFNTLSKKCRRDIKHKENRITRFGKWDCKPLISSGSIDNLFDQIVSIESRSRKAHTDKLFLQNCDNLTFLKHFYNRCKHHNWFDISVLTIDFQPIAYLLGFKYKNIFLAYNMAYNKDYHVASPGKILLNKKIKNCFDFSSSINIFDFSRGDFYIKHLWAQKSLQQQRLYIFKTSFYSFFLYIISMRFRPLIKRLLKKHSKV